MCTEFNLKIEESTELLDTRIFDSYDCGSVHIVKAGKNSKGTQRYKCNNCKRRFINSTNHLMHWSHLSKEQWEILFLFFIKQ